MKTFNVLAAVLALSTTLLVPVAAQTPEVEAVLDKAGDYVTVYERTFVGVVAKETYRQDVRGRSGTDPRGFATGQRQVEDIAAESARCNIGGVNRNVNLPVLALTMLEPQNRAWFSFKGGRKSGGVFELEYQEERGGTLIRTTGDQAMPSHGRFTIDSATGCVLSSELIAENRSLRAQIDVTYALELAMGGFVPREMREKYALEDGSTIEGKASYAKFRRYLVKVDEKIVPIK